MNKKIPGTLLKFRIYAFSEHVLTKCRNHRGIYSADFVFILTQFVVNKFFVWLEKPCSHSLISSDMIPSQGPSRHLSASITWPSIRVRKLVRSAESSCLWLQMELPAWRKGHQCEECPISSLWWCSRHSLRSSEEPTSPSICRDLRSLDLRDELSCIGPHSLPLLFPLFILLQLYRDSSIELWPLLFSSVTSCTAQTTAGSLWSLSLLTLNNFPFI